MPDIPLHEYLDRIEGRIRSGEPAQAIAHGRHLLAGLPECIWVHRALGEAYLESGMLAEAQASFERVLAADPENAIAQIALSLAYDRQGMLPQAIWHMERAFEAASANAEVRAELQALYRRRGDTRGAGPALTRGAMARIYAQNGMLERAIAEFQEALHQAPELPDLRAGLLEVQWRAGRGQEALATCRQLLDRLPHCLKALLIQGQLLLEEGHEAQAATVLTRAQALDPENRLAHAMMGERSPLPSRELLVPERTAGGEWGVAGSEEETMIEEEADDTIPGQEAPDWLEEATPADTPGVPPSADEEAGTEPAPAWIEPWAAGHTGDEESQEGSEEAPAETPEPPAWMGTLAEQTTAAETSMPAGAAAEDLAAPQETFAAEAGPVAPEVPQPDGAAGAVPEWVRHMEEAITDDGVPTDAQLLGTAPAAGPQAEIPLRGSPAERQRIDELILLLRREPAKYWARIELARLCCRVGDWDGALLQYEELIACHKMIRAVVLDLEGLLREETDRVQVYRLLGDAYMESDQIDQALEMYRLARQLLRKR